MYSGWKNEVFFIFRMKKEKKIIKIFLRGRKCVFLGEFKKIIIFQGKEVGIYLQFGFISSLDKKIKKKKKRVIYSLQIREKNFLLEEGEIYMQFIGKRKKFKCIESSLSVYYFFDIDGKEKVI